jgi:hypothetical protein
MPKRVLIVGLLVLIPTVAVGWQIASAELDNIEFHSDLRDISTQAAANVGLDSPKTDDQVRDEVVTAAAEHRIHLQPDQVKVERFTRDHYARFGLAVDYTARVNLLVGSFNLHFVQTCTPNW